MYSINKTTEETFIERKCKREVKMREELFKIEFRHDK